MPRLLIAVAIFTAVPAFAQPGAMTPIAEIARGSQVTLQGTVARIPDEDEFILTDATGSIEVYLGPTRVPVAVGEVVSVSGFVDNDIAAMDVCATSITRADGTIITIPNCDG